MPTWLWRALALASIALSLVLAIGDIAHSGPSGNFGFGFDSKFEQAPQYVITHVDANLPAARAGLRAGDRIAPASDDLANKVSFFYPAAAPGASLSLVVERNGLVRHVTLRAIAPKMTAYEGLATRALVDALQTIRIIFFLVAGLIVVRRADRADARALATFLIAFGFGTVTLWPWYPPAITAILAVAHALAVPFALTQAIRFATIFPRPSLRGPRPAIARANVWIAGAAMLSFSARTIVVIALDTLPGWLERASNIVILVFAVYVVTALTVAFAIAMRESEADDRERVRWIALSTAIGLCGLIIAATLQNLGVGEFIAVPFVFALAAIPVGTAYAILRHRMLDIGFVLNRALVFGAISALVVASFSLLEFVLGKYLTSFGHVQSAVLEALLALGIGVSLGRIHTRVDAVVDTVFFRDRHRAEASLHRLAREAAYIDDPHILGERIVAAVDRHANANGTALYIGNGRRYASFLATLAPAPPIERNDPAIVRMRAISEPVDLTELADESGPTMCPGALAFPMILRGELLGFLTCGPKRNLETYAPDERATLAELTHATGLAFETIQTRALRHAVDRALAGEGGLEELRRARLTDHAIIAVP